MPIAPRMGPADWVRLLLAALAGAGGLFLLQLLLLRTLLEPQLIQESELRITRSVRLVEGVLRSTPSAQLPPGVITRHQLPADDASPRPAGRFDARVIEALRRNQGLEREFRRDRPPLQDPWGGYWIRLQHRAGERDVWLYQPERLTSLSVWFLPILRSAAIVSGLLLGIALFLRSQVEMPFRRVVAAIPDTDLPPLALLPERGIAPLRLLTLRINRLLERINAGTAERRLLLRGLAHDLSAPQSRLLLQVEQLRDRLEGPSRAMAEAALEEVRRLVQLSDQLTYLAAGDQPASAYEWVSLDDFCARLAASYPHPERIRLAVPRLLLRLDGAGLERSLCNLIDNALEYGRPPLLLSAGLQQQCLWIRLDDHGPGLATPTLITMPRPPRSNDRQRSRHHGLGLQLVERYCRGQGGRLVLARSPAGGLRAEMQLSPTAENPLFVPAS